MSVTHQVKLEYLRVPVEAVRPDPQQPRQYFRGAAMKALAASIKSVGQRTPIEVRPLPAGDTHRYEIIDGERRWRACQAIGQKTIRACIEVDALPHQRQHLLSIIFHREGHTHIEISNALAYQVEQGATPQELAESLGKSDQWVYSYLQLQQLSSKLQALMHPDTPDQRLLRFNVALVLAAVPTAAEQLDIHAKLKGVPRTAQLQRARELVAKATGKERVVGKKRDIRLGFERFVARLAGDMERVLDLKQSEFAGALHKLPKVELQAFRDGLASTREHLKLLLDATDRELRK